MTPFGMRPSQFPPGHHAPIQAGVALTALQKFRPHFFSGQTVENGVGLVLRLVFQGAGGVTGRRRCGFILEPVSVYIDQNDPGAWEKSDIFDHSALDPVKSHGAIKNGSMAFLTMDGSFHIL